MAQTSTVSGPVGGPVANGRRFFGWPTTTIGWWAFGLVCGFVALMLLNGLFMNALDIPDAISQSVLPFYGIGMMAIGAAAGVTGVIAILAKRERSVLVWLPVVAGLFVVTFLLGEFLVPH